MHVYMNIASPDTATTVWIGNGGMGYGGDYWGLYRDYYRDPFPHSLNLNPKP